MSGTKASCYRAEKIKFRNTFTTHLFWVMPLSVILISLVLARNYVVMNSYNWWYILMLPGMLALLCCLTGQKDKKLKNRAVLSIPVNLKQVWDVKVLLCAKGLIFANILLVLAVNILKFVLESCFGIRQVIESYVLQGIAAAGILILVFLWQIPFCLWLTHMLGFFPAFCITVILNELGGTIGALGSSWLFIPFAIPARLMCAVLKILPNNLVAEEGSMTFFPELLDKGSIFPGILVSLLWFLAIWMATRIWYEKKGARTV